MSNPTCLVLIGLPASGKSTFAASLVVKKLEPGERRWVRVNNDDTREALFADRIPKGKQREDLVGIVRRAMIRQALIQDFNVVVDNTGLNPEVCEEARLIAQAVNADYEEKSFLDVPVTTCLDRDRVRDHRVGDGVILGMVKKWGPEGAGVRQFVMVGPADVPTVADTRRWVTVVPGLPPAIIVDIDGTLALHRGRSPYDYSRVGEDAVNLPVARVLADRDEAGDDILIVSGRDDSCREATQKWLDSYGITCNGLFMRKTGDTRADDIVKTEIFDQHIRGRFNVRFVLDDRARVVKAWRHVLGLTCFQVADGNF